jgi:hypothetical protein
MPLSSSNPVELSQLLRRVAAVAGTRVDLRRTQQPYLVVMPQRANGHRSEPGELSDVYHDKTTLHPSRGVRVKTFPLGPGHVR